MKLYSDAFTGTEVLSDSYKFEELYNGAAVEIKARFVVKGNENVDIGCGNAFGGGGEDEGGDAEVEKVLDVVDTFNLQ